MTSSVESRQCVILAGGLGTRLGPLTEYCPKPMLPVADRPFIEHLICNAARFGFRDFLVLAGHNSQVIKDHFTGSVFRTPGCTVTVRVIVEPMQAGTGGALRYAAKYLESNFLLINGDSLFGFNWLDLCAPLQPNVVGRIALRDVADASRYGVVEVRSNGFVSDMKVRPKIAGPGLINGGVYWLSRDILRYIDSSGSISLEQSVLPRVISDNYLIYSKYDGSFIDIGVPDDYKSAGPLLRVRKRAVFFDRDGVLNEDFGYVHCREEFKWRPGAMEAIRFLNDRDILVFVVTNQSGVARGFYTEADVKRLHSYMQLELSKNGAHIDDFRYCPHHQDAIVESYRADCHWRKPQKGMLSDICANWPVDTDQSVLFGDKDTDLEAGLAMGIKAVKVSGSQPLDNIVKSALGC